MEEFVSTLVLTLDPGQGHMLCITHQVQTKANESKAWKQIRHILQLSGLTRDQRKYQVLTVKIQDQDQCSVRTKSRQMYNESVDSAYVHGRQEKTVFLAAQ